MKKLIYFIATIIMLLAFTSCSVPRWVVDREKQELLFFKCMEKTPKGPTTTKYNDWDEVIRQCFIVSREMSGEFRKE